MERRLAAILAMDVVGFSRLMGFDEPATLEALNSHRRELIDVEISRYKGRVFKLTGDGMLVEFPSVVSAVACAADVQRGMLKRNLDVVTERRIEFRIGVNLGDVLAVEDDIFGDGVNVAARIESVARPGGVTVSGTVRDHVGNKLAMVFEDRGEQMLKNIDRPVRLFDISPNTIGGAGGYPLPAPATIVLAKPSIAVLPFANMSGDGEQEYFADGITEDIITDLAKVSALSVIARNSVFAYKGQNADIQAVGRRFNVSHVVEGSIRKARDRVRITAQLIDVPTGMHLWGERYDRDLTDIFAVQDEIANTIVEQLQIKLLPRERTAIAAWPTTNVDAYNFYLRGRHLYHLHTAQHVEMARRMFWKAVELDPNYARAYAGLADAAFFLFNNQQEGVSIDDIYESSRKALELDPELAEAHASYGIALHYLDRYTEAVTEFQHAIDLNPDLYDAHYLYGMAARDHGDIQTVIRLSERSVEIWPEDYREWLMLGGHYHYEGRTEDALRVARIGLDLAERALRTRPDIPLAATLGAGCLATLGDTERALEWLLRAVAIAPDDPLTQFNAACAYSVLGKTDEALGLIERWAEKATRRTGIWLADLDFDNIRDQPRFQALLEKVGVLDAQLKASAAIGKS